MTTSKAPDLKPFDFKWLEKRVNVYAIITPDQAAELMARNENNRRIKQLKIDQYARDMRAGRWNADSSDISFDWNGRLANGQNRLLACIQADVPFPTLVRTGIDPTAVDSMDAGAVRTFGDVLKMHAAADPNNAAAAISLRARYESIAEQGGTLIERRLPLTRQEVLAFLTEHPQLEKMITVARSMYSTAPSIPRSVWLAGMSMASERSEDDARRFAGAFLAGETTGTGDPIIALMRYAMAIQQTGRGGPTKLKNAGLRHLLAFVTAWNAWRADEKLDAIKIRDNERVVPAL
jgi:hypothetical protein